MALFWIPIMREGGPRWAALPLAGAAYAFVDDEPYVRRADPTSPQGSGEILLSLNARSARSQWLLVAAPGSRLAVNGNEVLLGAYALLDHDELRLANGRRLFFSTERLPSVVRFPRSDHEIRCARCDSEIAQGSPAVECTRCGAWCHQSDLLTCWRYEGTTHCPRCDQSNSSEAGFRWSPAAS